MLGTASHTGVGPVGGMGRRSRGGGFSKPEHLSLSPSLPLCPSLSLSVCLSLSLFRPVSASVPEHPCMRSHRRIRHTGNSQTSRNDSDPCDSDPCDKGFQSEPPRPGRGWDPEAGEILPARRGPAPRVMPAGRNSPFLRPIVFFQVLFLLEGNGTI